MNGNSSGNPLAEVFSEPNFRLLFVGQAIALLGEQINLIALPWLALQITGDPLALGSVLAVGGIPPALLMLLGGATTDRFSPRAIMLFSDALRLVLAGSLAVLVLFGWVNLRMLLVVSLGFGLLSAFSQPAAGSIVPCLVPTRQLQTGNSLFISLAQFAAFAGPALAGFLIASRSAGESIAQTPTPAYTGTAPAFGIYALGLLVSVITLSLIKLSPYATPSPADSNLLQSIRSGLEYTWHDPLLRLLIPAILTLNLLLSGPLSVGMPVLARDRLPEGVAALGLVVSAFGGGNLFGTLLAGAARRTQGLGLMLTLLFAGFGMGVLAMAWVRWTWLAFLILFLMGSGNGYLSVFVRTMLHRSAPPGLLGRVMGLYLFAKAALVPVSRMAGGAIVAVSLSGIFWVSGVLLILLATWLFVSPVPGLFEMQVERTRHEAHKVS